MDRTAGAIGLMGSEPLPEHDIYQRHAFGHVVNPAFWGIDLDKIPPVEATDLAQIDPDHLSSVLWPARGPTVVGGVAWNNREYNTLLRYPGPFRQKVVAQVLAARALDPDIDRREAAAGRALQHAFTRKAVDLEKMLVGYHKEQARLLALERTSYSPGYAHKQESSLRQLATSVWTGSFTNILEVAATQETWDTQKYMRMETALTRRLVTGPQRDKVGYWRQMMRLGLSYNRAKRLLTIQRIRQIERQLAEIAE